MSFKKLKPALHIIQYQWFPPVKFHVQKLKIENEHCCPTTQLKLKKMTKFFPILVVSVTPPTLCFIQES